ncbi:MAG: phosphodiester glycosidase family protein [bacterium]|nr:phosphodiester glycosidase family protein [bacterium]
MKMKWLCLFSTLMILCLVCSMAVAEEIALPMGSMDEIGIPMPENAAMTLPIDFSAGQPLQASGFKEHWVYEDPTISVRVDMGRVDDCDWWRADIRIADPSQLRTISAGGFDTSKVMQGTQLAKRVNAVLAIDGDYYWYTGKGYIVRQGVEYLNILDGKRDVLLIDDWGDFHVIKNARAEDVSMVIGRRKVVNAFFFGPALVMDGQEQSVSGNIDMVPDEKRQRMAICQVGDLHYMAICCAPPARGSKGMTLQRFARLCAEQGVQTAYNMDGGDSTMLIFNGEKLNDITSNSTREISDIIYFASAYVPEESK